MQCRKVHRARKGAICIGAILSSAIAFGSNAQDSRSIEVDLAARTSVQRSLTALSNDLFGEKVGLYTGATQFSATDVSIPGNSALPVEIKRTRRIENGYYATASMKSTQMFADWDLEVPYLSGTFQAVAYPESGWRVSTAGQPNKRCTVNRANPIEATPPVAQVGSDPLAKFSSAEYWYGNKLNTPDGSVQEMVVIDPANTNKPASGDYYWTTESNWVFSCLPIAANGVTGEAFLATSPDGTKYKFDWFVDIPEGTIEKQIDRCTVPQPSCFAKLARYEVRIYPTLVTDRFGNTVTYTYDPAKRGRLLSIKSSDNRLITLSYDEANNVISSITANGRVWRYAYVKDPFLRLSEVTLPDNTKWKMAGGLIGANVYGRSDCTAPAGFEGGDSTLTITHPSGAVGKFTFTGTRHTRSYVPRACILTLGGGSYSGYSLVMDTPSIVKKEVSGTGIQGTLIWEYSYTNPMWGFADDCQANGCATTKSVTLKNPDGSWQKTTFSNKFNELEGKPLVVETGVGTTTLKKEEFSYQVSSAGQAYPQSLGKKPCYRCDDVGEFYQPTKKVVTTQDGAAFTYAVNGYSAFAEPVRIFVGEAF